MAQPKIFERVIDRETLAMASRVFRDTNPIHTNRDEAQPTYRDTPAQGVLIQSYFEVCALMNGENPWASKFDMRNPAYPGDTLTFGPGSFTLGDYNGLEFTCENQDGVMIATYKGVPSKKLRLKPRWPLVTSTRDTITEEDVAEFYDFMGIENIGVEDEDGYKQKVPRSLMFSLVPSSLLKMIEKRNGSSEGTYKKIFPTFYREPEVGDFNTNIFLKNQKEVDGGHAYLFMAICREDGSDEMGDAIVASGDVTIFSPVKLEVKPLKVIVSQAAS